VATTGPRRRRSDARPSAPPAFGPTPGVLGAADPDAVERSVELALEASRRRRRPLTLVVLEAPADGGEEVLQAIARLVRSTVRGTDGLWRDGPASLVLVLGDVDGPGCEPALARLRLRMRREGLGGSEMGRAAPAPGIGAADLIDLARADRRAITRSRPSG
jgi:hypothetical protein